MKFYKQADLDKYIKNDYILDMLKKYELPDEKNIRTEKWLVEMDNKRLIYADVYGDLLLNKNKKLKVLDVGGGYNALTKILAENNNYTLLDFLAHDDFILPGGGDAKNIIASHSEYNINLLCQDWYDYDSAEYYDIIIANDIFPDVDQRLELFLDKYLQKCGELRLIATFYNEPKFYAARRVDDTEILTFLSWDGEILGLKLKKYLDFIDASESELQELKNYKDSVYWNGRQVAYFKFKNFK